jgi:hypothetical protein
VWLALGALFASTEWPLVGKIISSTLQWSDGLVHTQFWN